MLHIQFVSSTELVNFREYNGSTYSGISLNFQLNFIGKHQEIYETNVTNEISMKKLNKGS